MKQKIILLLIIAIAIFLRFFQLNVNPPSLTWDETAWGYNAYALGIDGKDEFGRFLPHDYLESFGDFKPPMYAYLDIIPVKIFGLNTFSVRFPSAFFGVATVLMTYFLTKSIFYNSKNKKYYALAASLFLAVSPWHIMLSRAAFEANIATFFIVTGVFFFLNAMQSIKNKQVFWYLVLSFLSLVASVYTFNTSRVVAPLLALALITIFHKKILKVKKQFILASIVGFLFLLPTIPFLLSPQARLRFQEVNIFSDSSVIKTSNQEIANDRNTWWSKVIHNRRFAYSVEFLKHYFDNLSPDFLFIKGDGNPKFSTQDVGEMYLWDLPFFVAGIIFLFRKKEGYWWIIPLWLVLGIIPAATARETPHALRIETTLPTFQIFVAMGFVEIVLLLKKSRKIVLSVLWIILFLNILYFQLGYYTHYTYEYSHEWQYGYSQSIAYVSSVKNSYDEIHVTEALGRPYIYYLFYTKTEPNIFRQDAKIQRDPFGFVDVTGFGKYIFQKQMHAVNNGKRILYINIASDVPDHANILKTFPLKNGEQNLVAYTL